MEMTASLFDNIIDTAQDCIFWKDKNRRFVGVNQAFLDFYGFDSPDVLIGKTDEDMGWHSDPGPFMQDEMRVLEGESTYKVLGKCVVKGEERDIIATKRPIYGGGEIVGLVGSFSDVTDVMRRKKEMEQAQVMYTREKLQKFSYFDKIMDEVSMDEILDSLTGIVSRAYILDFAKSLIAAKIAFTFTMVDLDNFKFINDTYGHHVGDHVLMEVSRDLAVFTDGYGIVGRFGGDELLIINLSDTEYEQKSRFFEQMYESHNILRKNTRVEGHELFITGTAGCATYPLDAKDYDELFSLIDKTLYHGKNRGRNCYTIYIEEEHGELEIKKIAKQGVYSCMGSLTRQLELVNGFENKLESVMPLLRKQLQITNLYYVSRSGIMHSVLDKEVREDVKDIGQLMERENLYSDRTLNKLRYLSPLLYSVLSGWGAESVLIVRIGMERKTYGYLLCAEPESQRIWQENECGILFFLAKMLAADLCIEGKKIPD